MCGESRTHGLEGVVEGRPSTTTLLACRKRADCEEKARQTERVVFVSILHYQSIVPKLLIEVFCCFTG